MDIDWLWSWGAGIWLLAVTGFGWSLVLELELEQPTVTEQTISTAAKMSALVFLPEVTEPQATELRVTERASLVVRIALMRVIGLPPADLRRFE
jgi:hypothetical protein